MANFIQMSMKKVQNVILSLRPTFREKNKLKNMCITYVSLMDNLFIYIYLLSNHLEKVTQV